MEPQIVIPDVRGYHNTNPNTLDRLKKQKAYKDLSTVIICPTRGHIHAKVVQSWMSLMRPMNQSVIGPLFAMGLEVGHAYNDLINVIITSPAFANFKYILSIEEDNMPPPDGLLKLYENIDKYDVIGGLYWTKGEEGQPMIYGNPKEVPKSFRPQMPIENSIQETNGLGQGFNLYNINIFKDTRIPRPWFRTVQEYNPDGGSRAYTQDLYFYEEAAKWGYKFACDTRVKVGHYDATNDIIW